MEDVTLEYLKKINRPAYDKLEKLYEEDLRERGIRRKNLTDVEFEVLLQNEYEGAIWVEEDPITKYGDKAFIWESQRGRALWDGNDWVDEDDITEMSEETT